MGKCSRDILYSTHISLYKINTWSIERNFGGYSIFEVVIWDIQYNLYGVYFID